MTADTNPAVPAALNLYGPPVGSADYWDSTKAPAEVDLSYTKPITSDDIQSQATSDAIATEQTLQARQDAIERENTSGYTLVADIARESITGTLIENAMAPAFKPDASFDESRLKKRLHDVKDLVPPNYIPGLGEAISDEHFDYLVKSALGHLDRSKQLVEAGFGWKAANFLANFFDPITFGLAIGTGGAGAAVANASKTGMAVQRSINAGAGALGGLAIVEADAIAKRRLTDNSELAWGTGVGLLLGGAFGPIAQNPATAAEGAALANAGKKLIGKLEGAAERIKKLREKDTEVTPEPPTSAPPSAHVDTGGELPHMSGDTKLHGDNFEQAVREAARKATLQAPVRELHVGEGSGGPAHGGTPERVEGGAGSSATAFDPHEFSLIVKLRREGEDALRKELAKYDLDKLQKIASAQHVKVNAPETAIDDIVAGTKGRINSRAAFAGSPDGFTEMMAKGAEKEAVEKAAQTSGVSDQITHFAKSLGVPDDIAKTFGDNVAAGVDAITPAQEAVKAKEKLLEPHENPGVAALDPEYAAKKLPTDMGAASADIVSHAFTDDPLWKSINDKAAPKSWGFWRWDRGGRLGKNENAAARLVGSYLLNDSAGKPKGSLNPFSADQDMLRINNVFMGEYNRARIPALNAWGKLQGLNPIQTRLRASEFYELVGQYVAGRNEGAEYAAPVKQLGDAVKRVMNEARKQWQNPLRKPFVGDDVPQLQGRAIPGSENIAENDHYLWRLWKNQHIMSAAETSAFGQSGLEKTIRGAIVSANEDLPEHVLDALAKGFTKSITRRAAGITDEWSTALGTADRAAFERALQQGTRLSQGEINDLLDRFIGLRPDNGAATTNLKRRLLLDESYVEKGLPHGTLGQSDLAIRDLLENNVDMLTTSYMRRMSGRVALARVRVKLPEFERFKTEFIKNPDGTVQTRKVPDTPGGGETLINGITTDAEMDHIKTMVQSWGADNLPRTEEGLRATESAIKQLQFAYDRIKGVPDPAQMSDMAWGLRQVRRYNSTRLMGQVGIAQLGETAQPVATLGIRAAFKAVPAFRRIIDEAGDSQLNNVLFQEIEHMGIGAERLHGYHFHNYDEAEAMPFTLPETSWRAKTDDTLKLTEQVVYELSGQNVIQVLQERATAAMVLHKLSQMAETVKDGKQIGGGDVRRLAQLGIDENTAKGIFEQMGKHSESTPSYFFGMQKDSKLTRLNLQNWDNLEARAALENGVFRMTRKLIQSPDLGSAAHWMSDPIWQTFFQFRGFTFTGWANQTLYNINIGDMAAFNAMTWSVAWNAAVRAAQIQILAQGRADKEKYLDKNLDPWELAKSGFQRAGWTSILPMLADTALTFGGQPSQFDARSSGQPATIVAGSPTISGMNQAMIGIGSAVRGITTSDRMSQNEARQLFGVLPGSNLLPSAVLYSTMIKDLPQRSHAEQRHYR